ncbi:Nitrilase [Sporothrix curviconia]|uniref:Nitrilase n=1 Tax=Sporothrix curviconia TaxID=1260050 RepID=A0ABP0CWQ6_9PEZI
MASSKKEVVRVAAVQAAPFAFDLAKSLEKLRTLTAEAAIAGADLVVFPEAFLSAYPWRYNFDATVGARRKWFAKYYDSAVAIPSPEFTGLSQTAKQNRVFLHVGIVEKEGGTLYCTSVLFDREGSLLYKHRKLVPTAAERLVWGRGAGDGLAVSNTELGNVGGLICWENYMPAARMALYEKGVEIYLAPTADDLTTWVATMQHIAKEGRCFVVSANSVYKVADFPPDYPPFTLDHHDRSPDGSPWGPDDILNHGGSCIVSPLGEFVAEPVWDKEAIVYADLHMPAITEARMDFDPVGSYSRPDVFTLIVNTKSGTGVQFA